MNKENLLAMANFIATIPQEKFTMMRYRASGESKEVDCNSVGCVIGHAIVLDKNFEKDSQYYRYPNDTIKFSLWSAEFTGLDYNSLEWKWCFGTDWSFVDNTPIGASKRILYFLKNGMPDLDTYYKIISGINPLPY